MSQNYQQFSTLIEGLSRSETDWLKRVDELIDDAPETYVNLKDPEEVATDDDEVEAMQTFKAAAGDYFAAVTAIAYNDDGEKRYICQREVGPDGWWLYEEENCDIDGVAEYIRQFFKRWRPLSYVVISWADTCSKMRVNQFGGGEMLVTADWYHVIPTGFLLNKMAAKYTGYRSDGRATDGAKIWEEVLGELSGVAERLRVTLLELKAEKMAHNHTREQMAQQATKLDRFSTLPFWLEELERHESLALDDEIDRETLAQYIVEAVRK